MCILQDMKLFLMYLEAIGRRPFQVIKEEQEFKASNAV